MTTNHSSIIKKFLEEVKAGNITERAAGLCGNFQRFCIMHDLSDTDIKCTREIFKNMLYNFPGCTGDYVYPLVPLAAYHEHLRTEADFYDPTTSYGAIRLEFVDWALKEIA